MPGEFEARLGELRAKIIDCRKCPRLVSFREMVPARAAFRGQEYWRRPIPGFGDPEAWLMILGLAPAAHGGNRTGRAFTGDASAKFLIAALHKAGLASQPTSTSREDGLWLEGCYIAAAVRCVPPGDKPTPQEFRNCSPYLEEEFEILGNLSAVLALGQLAFRAYLDLAKRNGARKTAIFAHGASVELEGMPRLYGSYHPSPRNTYTGRLTQAMLLDVLKKVKDERYRSVADDKDRQVDLRQTRPIGR